MPPATPSSAVLVTGCSSGIGRAVAARLARSGRPVWATARQPGTLAELASLGARTLALDVTDEDSMRAAVEQVEAEHGAVGALVNNAGYGLHGPVETTPVAEVRRQLETNLIGPVRLIQLVLPGMRRRRAGRIVNLSSMGGRLTLPGGAFYHASKYALEAVSDALRFELRPFGIQVVLIEPGPVLSGFSDAALATMPVAAGPGERAGAAPGGEAGVPGSAGEAARAYAAFTASVTQAFGAAYTDSGPLARLSSRPGQVAAVVERALAARSPRPRYVVGPIGRTLVGLRRVLPDRAFDLLLRAQYRPAPERR
ncbi:MAG TPA: SDR family NAD(P)-dependent oxidoreductase [Actinomycetes bacterium]|nr:SDR family NAD(P)-dependent oxidoreductase [Actinomycetes bacterium]